MRKININNIIYNDNIKHFDSKISKSINYQILSEMFKRYHTLSIYFN
jgi:hypothetical protein